MSSFKKMNVNAQNLLSKWNDVKGQLPKSPLTKSFSQFAKVLKGFVNHVGDCTLSINEKGEAVNENTRDFFALLNDSGMPDKETLAFEYPPEELDNQVKAGNDFWGFM